MHQSVGDAAYRALDPTIRASLHASIASVLATEVDTDPETLFRHLTAADQPAEAAPYRLRAAQAAESKLAFEHAIRLYGEAMTNEHLTERERFEATLARARLGRRALPLDQAEQMAIEVLDRVDGHGELPAPYDSDDERRLLRKIWYRRVMSVRASQGRVAEARDTFERAWRAFWSDSIPRRARALLADSVLAASLMVGVASANRRAASREDLVDSQFVMDTLLWLGSEYPQRTALLIVQWQTRLAAIEPTPEIASSFLEAGVVVSLALAGAPGLRELNTRNLRNWRDLVATTGDPVRIASARALYAVSQSIKNDFQEIIGDLDEATVELRRLGADFETLGIAEMVQHAAWFALGRDEELLQLVDKVYRECDATRVARALSPRVRVLLRLGKREQVRVVVDEVRRGMEALPQGFFRWICALCCIEYDIAYGDVYQAVHELDRIDAAIRGPMRRNLAAFLSHVKWLKAEGRALRAFEGDPTWSSPRFWNHVRHATMTEDAFFQARLFRGLALDAYAHGKRRISRRMNQRALELSAASADVYQRQLVLEAAAFMFGLNPALERELDDLRGRFGYADPLLERHRRA